MVTTRRARYDDFEAVSRLLTELGRTPLHGGNEEWFRAGFELDLESWSTHKFGCFRVYARAFFRTSSPATRRSSPGPL